MATTDVVQKVISGNAIKHGTAICGEQAGIVQKYSGTNNDRVMTGPSVETVEARYTNKFDDNYNDCL